MSVQSGTQLHNEYGYDELNRLVSLSGAHGTTTYGYDANGNLLSETTGIFNTKYTYNNAGLLKNKTNLSGGGGLQSADYQYYLDGNIRVKYDSSDGWFEYQYDGLGRLAVEYGAVRTTYTNYKYDDYGNRLSKQVEHDIAGILQDHTYAYDPNGNMLSSIW